MAAQGPRKLTRCISGAKEYDDVLEGVGDIWRKKETNKIMILQKEY